MHVSVRTSLCKGGALGPEKGRGKQLGYKRLHTLQQAQGSRLRDRSSGAVGYIFLPAGGDSEGSLLPAKDAYG